MKRRFAKFVLIVASVVTISLASSSDCKAFVYANLFGFGVGYHPYYQSGYYPSAYRGYGYTGYRSAYYGPRASYYHTPVSSYGRGGYSTRYRGFYSPWGGRSSCGCTPCGNGVNTGCSTGRCSTGGCATGQCGVNYNTQSPTPLSIPDEGYSGAPTPVPAKSEKFERRKEELEDIDKTGSKTFKPSRDADKIQNNDIKKNDNKDAFGGTKGLNENLNRKGATEKRRDGIGTRKSEEEKLPIIETPKLPEDDPFTFPEEKRSTFKVPASTPVKKLEAVEALDKIMDDFNGEVIKKQKGAPTKTPVEENKPFIKKKKPAEMPRLEVKPIGLDDSVAWKTIPTYRRLTIRSQYFAPQIARTRLILDGGHSSPLHHLPETKLVSK